MELATNSPIQWASGKVKMLEPPSEAKARSLARGCPDSVAEGQRPWTRGWRSECPPGGRPWRTGLPCPTDGDSQQGRGTGTLPSQPGASLCEPGFWGLSRTTEGEMEVTSVFPATGRRVLCISGFEAHLSPHLWTPTGTRSSASTEDSVSAGP